jgi:membrane protein implicated in regulation of membrane protease activity
MPEILRPATRFRQFYGSHPLHLLMMIAGFALLGYIVITAGPATLWKPQGAWWHSVAVWLAAAFITHDLVLFPMYALADRLLGVPSTSRHRVEPPVAARNHLRMPALGSGLLLLIFFPGIVRQGAALYAADTGLTQQSFLGRWLLLTAAMSAISAVVYAVRHCAVRLRRRRSAPQANSQEGMN